MIKETKPLSMSEAQEYLGEENTEIKGFLKNFKPISVENAKKLRESLESLDLIQLNDLHISKIIDLLPSTKEELSKILSNVNFTEDETNKILSTIKENN